MESTLNETNTILTTKPIYIQLMELFENDIRNGKLKEGDHFPSEREISERYRVSRVTANKAVSSLVERNLLYREPGKGTFVAGKPLSYQLGNITSFANRTRAQGFEVKTEVLNCDVVGYMKDREYVFDKLQLSPDDKLVFICRKRYVNGIVVIYEKRYIPQSLVPGITGEMVSDSFYAGIDNNFHIPLNRSEQMIRAEIVEGEMFNLPGETVALHVEGTTYLEGNRIFEFENTFYRGDKYTMYNTLGAYVDVVRDHKLTM